MKNYTHTIKDRFFKYVKYNTQSAYNTGKFPSTEGQLLLLRELKKELEEMGMQNVKMDKFGYVTAVLPSNSESHRKSIGLFAHVDTALEVSGENVNPIVHSNYAGGNIILPKERKIITTDSSPYLSNLIGHDIVTSDGSTLLGADDKSGIAIIMDVLHYFLTNPNEPHHTIKVCFNPDEEIGAGMDHFDAETFKVDFGYTLDGSDLGEIQFENFNADSMHVKFLGKSIHPGYAKDIMKNALKSMGFFLSNLPNEFSPEATDNYQGFIHPVDGSGGTEEAEAHLIIRSFDLKELKKLEKIVEEVAEKAAQAFHTDFEIEIKESYRNMAEVLRNDMRAVDLAKLAMEKVGITPKVVPIRGGTDGARLTYMGIPCPNLFTGQQNYHSKTEYISLQDMEKSAQVVIEILREV